MCILALVIMTCKSHVFSAAFYCRLWPVCLYHTFPHYLTNGLIFGEKMIDHKMCFVFIYNPLKKILIARSSERTMIINVQKSSRKRGKGKAIQVQAWTGPEGSRRLTVTDFKTIGT